MRAARSSANRFTLLNNWRSGPKLITAVNTLFSGVGNPFVFEAIPFEAGRPAPRDAEPTEYDDGPPLILWYLDSKDITGSEKPINKPSAVRLIADAVGREIDRLLSGSSPAAPGSIAVLVRTNDQAQLMKDVLTARHIPSVLYTAANIFDSPEAMEMEIILSAIASPSDSARVKAALATDIMGAQAGDLISNDLETSWWEARLTRFREYFEIWQQTSFMRMFRLLLLREKAKDRLLSYPDGERRLTNVLHLLELLHRQTAEKQTGITGLLKWLAEQRDPNTPRLEENQLRLESDENAVRIVTIHKSKGLEYPVVFCPFGWEGSRVSDSEFTFHDPDRDDRLSFDLGSEARDQHLVQAHNELLSENLRLLYVALTRARHRCYLAWGKINRAETSALAYLLHGRPARAGFIPGEDQTSRLKTLFKDKTGAALVEDLNRLVAKSQNSIAVVPLPLAADLATRMTKQRPDEEQLFCRRFTENIDRSWKISSYSSLVSTGISNVDLPDRDEATVSSEPVQLPASDELATASGHSEVSVFDFPRGARAGSFFHDIFEHYDFSEKKLDPLSSLVAAKLLQYGFDPKWHQTVCRAITTVLAVPLHPNLEQFRLSSLKPADRLNEMEFYFPLNPVTPGTLKNALKAIAGSDAFGQFSTRLERLSFAACAGFMKGYIDMVFHHEGRFYLLDWKSNHLGPTLDCYDPSALQEVMAANYYILQYHIYTLALHQSLRYQQPDYRYEKDFGGVFYVFIRGVNQQDRQQHGIFYDRPDEGLIDSLGQALIPGYK
jgi:exodeoxyribonuclease V beta subunit